MGVLVVNPDGRAMQCTLEVPPDETGTQDTLESWKSCFGFGLFSSSWASEKDVCAND